jgi:uncharacterized protein
MENQNFMVLKDNTANPAPLGLTGFALTTILLNLHNAGLITTISTVLAMGITIGGISQAIVGIMEWKKNNTFGATAFTAYGFFWLSLVLIIMLPNMGYNIAKPDKNEMSAYLALWGIFTLFLFIGTLRISVALQLLFGTLAILFFLLAIGDFTENSGIKVFAGYEGIVCGLIALYTAMGQVLNEVYGKIVMPLGVVKKK